MDNDIKVIIQIYFVKSLIVPLALWQIPTIPIRGSKGDYNCPENTRFLETLSRCLQQQTNHSCRALEVGCGTGIDSYLLAQKTGCSGYGIDLSDEALNLARKAGQRDFVHALFIVPKIMGHPGDRRHD